MPEISKESVGGRVCSAKMRAGSVGESFHVYVILVDREE
jgi:hypothetical protein